MFVRDKYMLVRSATIEGQAAPVDPPVDAPPAAPVEETVEGQAPAAEPAAAAPAAPEPAPEPSLPAWAEKRIDKMNRERREAQEQAQALQRQLDELRKTQQAAAPAAAGDDAELERRVNERATAIAQQRMFEQTCNQVASSGRKEFPDFDAKLKNWEMIGGIPQHVFDAAIAAGNTHEVLYALGSKPEEALRIAGLSPIEAAIAIAKMPPLARSAAPAPISSAPDPTGRARGTNTPAKAIEDMSMDEYMAYMDKQEGRT